jgi:hypothetical protein
VEPTAGGADRFLRFLTEELIPLIDARYRTAPFRLLFGHSLGGLLALHTLVERPDVFRGVLAASPSLWWNDGAVAVSLARAASGLAPRERALFLACGDEDQGMVGPLRRLDSALGAMPPARLRRRFTQLRDEDHMTTPHLTLYEGLKFVFEGWRVPDKLLSVDITRVEVDQIVAHHSRLSARFGFPVLPPEALLNGIGYGLLEAKKPVAALEVLARNAAFYPYSANAQDSWADALAQNGQDPEALACAERAVALARDARAPLLEDYERRAAELRARVAARRTQQVSP